jgi:hypothetical protein
MIPIRPTRISPELKEYIYRNPGQLPELPDPPEDEWDPFIYGGRIGAEDGEE